MAVSETFQFEELDGPSREYLLQVRERAGRGMPGIYVRENNYLPFLGCFFGSVVLIVMAVVVFEVITSNPLAVAMLETASLLVGGWMIIAAIRVWAARKGSRHIGHFVYVDADTLWECKGGHVVTTDIYGVIEARGTENFNQGKYQSTTIVVQTGDGSRKLTIAQAEHSRQLLVFLNVLAWMRGGGDGEPVTDEKSGEKINLKKLPAGIMSGVAKEYAQTGEMPKQYSAKYLELDETEVPVPKREGKASSGLLNYALIIAIAVGGVFIFKELNTTWRDDAIWKNINDIADQDKRAPWLRAYLADERNKNHRSEASAMLKKVYQDKAARIRQNQLGEKVDPDLFDGLEKVLLALAEKPLAVISFSVKEEGAAVGAAERENLVSDRYSLKLIEAMPELVEIVRVPPETPPLIEITYRIPPAQNLVIFSVRYRSAPDEEPVKSVIYTVASPNDPRKDIADAAQTLGLKTAGPKKVELPQFDF